MTLYQLECFIQVAEQLSFVRAAQLMCITQPAITYQIQTLEKEIPAVLFERNTRRCRLTPAGQAFYQDAVQLHSYYEQAIQKARDISLANQSHLRVGIRKLFDYDRMASMVIQFNEKYPHAKVDILPQNDSKPLDDLRSGRIDIGFFYTSEHADCSDISFEPLYQLSYYVLMNPNDSLADRKSLQLPDLKGKSIVTAGSTAHFLSATQGPTLAELKNAGADISQSAPSFESALIAIRANRGMLILPMLRSTVVPGMAKLPLLGCPPVHIQIGWMKRDTRMEIPDFVEIAKNTYKSLQ